MSHIEVILYTTRFPVSFTYGEYILELSSLTSAKVASTTTPSATA